MTGLSHQTVGRILHKQAQGESLDWYSKRPQYAQAIDAGLKQHTDLARSIARKHGLPFRGELPLLARRLPLKQVGVFDQQGKQIYRGPQRDAQAYIAVNGLQRTATIRQLLGDRVIIDHAHWLRDSLRNKWLTTISKTGAYYQASVGSVVSMALYNRQAQQRATERRKRGLSQRTDKALQGQYELKSERENKRIFTPYSPMNFPDAPWLIGQSIQQTLEARHAPATGEKGTVYADQILLQLDTRKQKTNANKPKPGKKGRTTRSRKRGNR